MGPAVWAAKSINCDFLSWAIWELIIFCNPVVALCAAWQGVRMGITPPGLRRPLQRGIRMDVAFGELHTGLVMLSFCLI